MKHSTFKTSYDNILSILLLFLSLLVGKIHGRPEFQPTLRKGTNPEDNKVVRLPSKGVRSSNTRRRHLQESTGKGNSGKGNSGKGDDTAAASDCTSSGGKGGKSGKGQSGTTTRQRRKRRLQQDDDGTSGKGYSGKGESGKGGGDDTNAATDCEATEEEETTIETATIKISVRLDDADPVETSWSLTNVATNEVVFSSDSLALVPTTTPADPPFVSEVKVDASACFEFTIVDGYDNTPGLCCQSGANSGYLFAMYTGPDGNMKNVIPMRPGNFGFSLTSYFPTGCNTQ